MTEAHDEDEWRKRITAVLRDGAQFVLLDNLKAPLNSAHLAAVLTSDDWTDRILGKSETVRIPNRAAWVATGNNLRMDGDIVRRTVWVRLDARTDRPWERDGFQHDPFMPWVRANRHELVWALLVVVQNWLVSGRPKWGGKPMGTFESWAETIGGILAAAGIKGFLENREALYEYADGETEEWRAFTAAWWERFENRELKANDLLPLIGEGEHLSSLVGAGGREVTPQQLRIRLGRALQQRRDRLVGRFFIRRVGQDSHRKGTLYRLDIAESREEPQRLSANSPHDLGPVSDSNAESAESAESYFHPHAGRTDDATPQQDVARTHIERRPDHSPQTPHSPQTDSGEVPKPAESGAPRLSAGCTCLRCPANAGGRCNCGRYWRDDAKGLRCWHDKEAQS
jgi:hypothetical protein